ncbi:hypothetical protein A0H81_03483 [Grifola frondosa]|uniref:Uncharacterized protein n=1 Tax=Grifola frondosa TaxID=5627 RepID=A0A1C7MKX7_GRIFR|nr:hypothetical protein A0H81_03483 [Grifola frondosa]
MPFLIGRRHSYTRLQPISAVQHFADDEEQKRRRLDAELATMYFYSCLSYNVVRYGCGRSAPSAALEVAADGSTGRGDCANANAYA